MKKLTKKEFILKLNSFENKDVYFISMRNSENLKEKLEKEIANWAEFNINYIPLIKERWILKPKLQIKQFSTFLELNDSRLDLKGKFWSEDFRNFLMVETEHYCICYMQID